MLHSKTLNKFLPKTINNQPSKVFQSKNKTKYNKFTKIHLIDTRRSLLILFINVLLRQVKHFRNTVDFAVVRVEFVELYCFGFVLVDELENALHFFFCE